MYYYCPYCWAAWVSKLKIVLNGTTCSKEPTVALLAVVELQLHLRVLLTEIKRKRDSSHSEWFQKRDKKN